MNVHPDFSVFEMIKKQSPSNIFFSNVMHMVHFSHIIERDIIEKRLQCDVYVGLQSIHNLLPILERYQQIAQVADSVYIYGVAVIPVPPLLSFNVVLLSPDTKLSREWFIVVNHPDYSRVLSAREVDKSVDKSPKRSFQAILTSDTEIVNDVVNRLLEYSLSCD